MLPPLGILFALFVAFTAQQVWADNDRANAAVDREASALRAALHLAVGWPGEPQVRLRASIRRYITEAVNVEWPTMAKKAADLTVIPRDLSQALELTLSLTPSSQGQQIAQREIVTELEAALAARGQRIIVSELQVNPLKWSSLLVQAGCALLAIAFVHCENRVCAALMMGLFATGVATSLLLIAAHDRPFIGEFKVRPDPLLQIMPEASLSLSHPSPASDVGQGTAANCRERGGFGLVAPTAPPLGDTQTGSARGSTPRLPLTGSPFPDVACRSPQLFPASKPATGSAVDISAPSIRNTRPCDADWRTFNASR